MLSQVISVLTSVRQTASVTSTCNRSQSDLNVADDVMVFLYDEAAKAMKDGDWANAATTNTASTQHWMDPTQDDIGEGGCGKVYKAHVRGRRFRGHVAVKCASCDEESAREQVEAELRAGEQLRHANIVQLVGWYSLLDDIPDLLLELCDSSLWDRQWRFNDCFTLNQRLRIAKDTLRGLAHAESQGIVHLDVKSANVLLVKSPVNGGWQAKLGDWGLSVKAGEATLPRGTAGFRDPDMLGDEHKEVVASNRQDMHGLGVVLLEMVARKPLQSAVVDTKAQNDATLDGSLFAKLHPHIREDTEMMWLAFALFCMGHKKHKRPLPSEALCMLQKLTTVNETGDMVWKVPHHAKGEHKQAKVVSPLKRSRDSECESHNTASRKFPKHGTL